MAEHLRAARRLALALLLQLRDQQVQLLDQGVNQVAAPAMVPLKIFTDHPHFDPPHWILDEFEGVRNADFVARVEKLFILGREFFVPLESLVQLGLHPEDFLGLKPVNIESRDKISAPLKNIYFDKVCANVQKTELGVNQTLPNLENG